MIIFNKKEYISHILRMTGILAIAFLILFFLKPSFWGANIILFVIIDSIFLSEKFTEKIEVTEDEIVLKYRLFFLGGEVRAKLSNIQMKSCKQSSLRSREYLVVQVFKQGKTIYEIDSRNGFDADELQRIIYFINQKNDFNSGS